MEDFISKKELLDLAIIEGRKKKYNKWKNRSSKKCGEKSNGVGSDERSYPFGEVKVVNFFNKGKETIDLEIKAGRVNEYTF